jgi:tetratricopeptide (TPR) repeat protein
MNGINDIRRVHPVALSKSSILLAALLTVFGCSDQSDTPAPADSHQIMLDTLKRVHQDSVTEHPFLGIRQLQETRLAVQQADPQTPPEQLSVLHGLYGRELLRMGRTAEAVEQMKRALQLLETSDSPAPETRQQLLYQLGVASLRLGENANCVHCVNGERCLFPIRDRGLHDDPAGSEAAIGFLQQALALDPTDLRSRWLLNIAAMTLGRHPEGISEQHRIPSTPPNSAESPVGAFINRAEEMGLDQAGWAGGIAVDDFDGDLDLDIFMSSWTTDGQLHYFRNEGDGTFSNQTEAAGLTGITGGLNILHADYDNDDDLDLLVLRGAWLGEHGLHPNSLLQNLGNGRFQDVTFSAGLADRNYPTQTAVWDDFDLDGDLDLFVGNENYVTQLYENEGNGHFQDVAIQTRANLTGFVKGCTSGDFNGDGYPDIYVTRLQGPNSLLRNNGDFTFTDVARKTGVTGPHNAFATWFWDLNNDGHLDLYTGSYEWGIQHIAADFLGQPAQTEPDALYLGQPDGSLRFGTQQLQYPRVTQPMGANFGDIDNDGFLDVALGTGYVDYEGLMPNLLLHNQRGQAFADITTDSRTGHLQKGHGMAFADLDHDGDQDLIAVMGGWFAGDSFRRAVFDNPGCGNQSITLRLRGVHSNRYGVGCRVKATFRSQDGQDRTIFRWMNTGGSFGSAPLRMHLGIESATSVSTLEVWWPLSKTRQTFHDIAAGSHVEVQEDSSELQIDALPQMQFPQRKQQG